MEEYSFRKVAGFSKSGNASYLSEELWRLMWYGETKIA